MIKKIINYTIDAFTNSVNFRGLIAYIYNRMGGFQYGSYNLQDEAALAICFLNDPTRSCVIVDAGANLGLYSNQILKYGISLDRLIMIEPQSALHNQLNDLCKDNPIVILEPVAIGEHTGEAQLFFASERNSLASVYARDLRHVGLTMDESELVPVTTLEKIVEKYSIDFIDYLKLDLEGHELQALKGAKNLLKQKRIRALTFEFGGCNIDSRTYIKDFWKILVEDNGFTFYRILPKRKLFKIGSYSESLERFDWQNILACAPGVDPVWKVINQ